jgi:tetratricopeptide (TPR) repeat protein
MRALLVALSLVALPLVAPISGCAKQPAPYGEPVDDVLLAYLSTARVLHHEADIAEDAGDLNGAIEALERLLAKAEPRKAPEIDEVIADTHARLADLRSRTADFTLATKHIDNGLSRATATSYFRGHLFEVRGLVEERLSKDLAAKGDTPGAAAAKDRAMKAYEEAIAIQDEVIKRGTADGGGK